MNSCKFTDNKWLTAIKVVYTSKGVGGEGRWVKNLKMVSLRDFKPLISKHTKKVC